VILFFLAGLELFYLGLGLAIPLLGFVFYVWVGIFNVSVIALFWSFANEVHTKEEGERLFPIIGIGASAGAWAGSKAAELLFGAGFGAALLLQIAAAILALHLGLYFLILRFTPRRPPPGPAAQPASPRDALSGFGLVFARRYVALVAALLILLNLVNSMGEFILSSYVVELANEALAAAGAVADEGAFRKQFIGEFYGGFFSWVNLLGVLLQAFVASRLVRWFGIGGVLLALPLVSLSAYSLAALGVSFVVFRWAKTLENATDYSIMNTAKNMLWLVTSREEKYKAKQAVDTFFVRLGDVIAAGAVFAGTSLGLSRAGFALGNVVVALLWLSLALLLVRWYRALARSSAQR
jgi:ATP:ADP antiporter, AAA family